MSVNYLILINGTSVCFVTESQGIAAAMSALYCDVSVLHIERIESPQKAVDVMNTIINHLNNQGKPT